MRDHIRTLFSIPPKYSIAQMVGFIKGKSAIQIARTFGGRKTRLHGAALLGEREFRFNGWPDEALIRQYIKAQEQENRRLGQLTMFE